MSGPAFTITWTKQWTGPICSPGECDHPTTEVLTINQRLEPKGRGRHVIALDGSICMNCGADRGGHLSLAEGLTRCMDEHGWHRATALRLYDLTESLHDQLVAEAQNERAWPIWFLTAWGWTGKEIVDALNAGTLAEPETADAR